MLQFGTSFKICHCVPWGHHLRSCIMLILFASLMMFINWSLIDDHNKFRPLEMFYNFYLVKNHKIAFNLSTTEAKEKYQLRFGTLKVFIFDICLINYESNQIFICTNYPISRDTTSYSLGETSPCTCSFWKSWLSLTF